MSDDTLVIIAIVLGALAIIVFVLYLAAGLVLMFTAFVYQLPLIISIIMFIVFPPTLIVYLVGLAFLFFGLGDKLLDGESGESTISGGSYEPKISERERARRRALGYDD